MTKPKVNDWSQSDETILAYLQGCIGKVVKSKNPLEYMHGFMVTEKITRIKKAEGGSQLHNLFFEATFTDGFKAEYVTDAIPFYHYYGEQL